jgi:hypothetical protein
VQSFSVNPTNAVVVAVISGCTIDNLISRNLFTVNVFAGGAEEFLLPNFRVGYFGMLSLSFSDQCCKHHLLTSLH